jgi:flavin-dependent dehydrogenase
MQTSSTFRLRKISLTWNIRPDLFPGEFILITFFFRRSTENFATVMENCSIANLENTKDGVACELVKDGKPIRVLAKLVVGAEGDRSIVAKKLSAVRKGRCTLLCRLESVLQRSDGFS